MELIYIWFENHRNFIKKGLSLSNKFVVNVSEKGHLDKECVVEEAILDQGSKVDKVVERDKDLESRFSRIPRNKDLEAIIPKIEIDIKKTERDEFVNIYGDNISSVSAIVGKNSVGKSNVIDCIGDINSVIDDSSFVIIYYDFDDESYVFECNQISVDFGEIKINAVKGSFQPMTKSVVVDKAFNVKELKQSYTEFITVSERLDFMVRPDANAHGSLIPRHGLRYDQSNFLYAHKYLQEKTNNESYQNNNIYITFEIDGNYRKLKHRILPDLYPGKKHGFDYSENGDGIYKKTFMLRFFERVLNNFRFIDEPETSENLKKLNEIIENSHSLEELLERYNQIKDIIITIRCTLNDTPKENTIDMDLCYQKFINELEKLVISTDESYFKNSCTLVGRINEIDNGLLTSVLQCFEESHVDLEFKKSINILFSNISDGLRYFLNLFSTISTCMHRNETEKFQNIILLLDEPEARFHPELARKFVSDLIQFLKDEFPKLRFQILISTHSPFILSDIVNENIIKVLKDERGCAYFENLDGKTFGADIHYLLKDAFFLNVTMGEFSRAFIQEIIERIKPDKNGRFPKLTSHAIRELHRKILIIADPLIKNKLLQMLGACTELDSRLDFLNLEKHRIIREIEEFQGNE